jgi:Tfp pilus assembly protein PilN
MIRVNLLPQEYRRAEATPLKQFFATVGSVVLGALAVVGWLYVHYGVLDPARTELDTIKSTVKTQLEGQVAESKNLATWLQDYKTQYDKIDLVAETRVLWARKLDELWEVVANPTPATKYEVWLKGLSGKVNSTAKSGGDVQFGGTSAGPQFFRLSDFNEAVRLSEFFKDFDTISYPAGSREELPGADRDPKEGWTFQLSLSLRPLKELSERRTKAALEAAGKK